MKELEYKCLEMEEHIIYKINEIVRWINKQEDNKDNKNKEDKE